MSFKEDFYKFIPELSKSLVMKNTLDWSIKGFIDSNKTIYTITKDTKVISKIIEIMIFPKILNFAKKFGYDVKLAPYQNYYPDMTFIDKKGNKFAVDLKSSYRITNNSINGMTLGAFTGYFRNRSSSKNIVFPYNEYNEHYVLGIIYSRSDIENSIKVFKYHKIEITNTLRKSLEEYLNNPIEEYWKKICDSLTIQLTLAELTTIKSKIDNLLIDELNEFNLENFTTISSVATNFSIFLQEKWRLATDKAGSGNTKNIGSEKNIRNLENGNGLFFRKYQEIGKHKFDLYWSHYLTKDMCLKLGLENAPYKDIKTFEEWLSSLSQRK